MFGCPFVNGGNSPFSIECNQGYLKKVKQKKKYSGTCSPNAAAKKPIIIAPIYNAIINVKNDRNKSLMY